MTTHKSEPIGTRQSPTGEVVVGVVADPVATALTVAKHLERELPGLLAEQLSDGSLESGGAPREAASQ